MRLGNLPGNRQPQAGMFAKGLASWSLRVEPVENGLKSVFRNTHPLITDIKFGTAGAVVLS